MDGDTIYLQGPPLWSSGGLNVLGEPVFSVMMAGWFCEKSSWIGKVEDMKLVLF